MKPEEKYWFFLEPYVFVDIKKDQFILYNTLDKSSIINDDKYLKKIIKSVVEPNNCGVVSLTFDEYNSPKLYQFVEDIRAKFMGDIIPFKSPCIKPVQPLPLVHLRENIQTYKIDDHSTEGTDVVKYLSEITIYLYTACEYNCKYCQSYNKQFHCCSKLAKETDSNIDLSLLKKLVESLVESEFSGRINLFAGDYLLFEQNIENLCNILYPVLNLCRLHCHAKAISHIPFNKLDIPRDNINVLLDDSANEELLAFLKKESIKNLTLIISNNEEFHKFGEMLTGDTYFNYMIQPFYTNHNRDFFKKYIYLNEKDILTGVKDMQYIHQNLILNSNFFGQLIMYPNGDIYTNTNSNFPIGNLGDNTVAEIVYFAITSKDSHWMKTRELPLCKTCIFQYLCPPTSNYELVFHNTPPLF